MTNSGHVISVIENMGSYQSICLKDKAAIGLFSLSIVKPKQSSNPVTRVKKPEPSQDSSDWIIWAAWADRITFEEIHKVTGLTESKVIAHMRKSLKPSSFRLWRKRASTQSIKHQKLFRHRRDYSGPED